MSNQFNRESSIHSRSGAIAPLVIALVLFSVPATAQVYPVNGAFSAIDAAGTVIQHQPIRTCRASNRFAVSCAAARHR
jgi:hypothetical protein